VRVTGFLDAKKRPLRGHENVMLFADGQTTFNPQMTKGRMHKLGSEPQHDSQAGVYGSHDDRRLVYSDNYYPTSVIRYSVDREMTITIAQRPNKMPIHPTQKPVELMRYLIRTYTNEGDTVLDFTCGSGSTGVACIIEKRNFIGIEKDETLRRDSESENRTSIWNSVRYSEVNQE
jgi:site-specific DNA-methyltransferase (adenine-specific)